MDAKRHAESRPPTKNWAGPAEPKQSSLEADENPLGRPVPATGRSFGSPPDLRGALGLGLLPPETARMQENIFAAGRAGMPSL
ncbi:MAG: hypothetical protein AB1814_04485 [Thermodesulfobacteriota bacterium]